MKSKKIQEANCIYLKSTDDSLKKIIIESVRQATKRFWCVSPFVTEDGLCPIIDNMKRGIDYRLITRLNNEDIFSGLIDLDIIIQFIQSKGKVRFHDRFLHSKLWISDDNVFIGSANLTGKALKENNELMVVARNDQFFSENRPIDWFIDLWDKLSGSEKTIKQLEKLSQSLKFQGEKYVFEKIKQMPELKDYGKGLNIIPYIRTINNWFNVDGTRDKRVSPDSDFIREEYKKQQHGGKTVSKRPSLSQGDKVILARLAINENGKNDYCVFGKGIVDVKHRKDIDKMPEWIKNSHKIPDEDKKHISRWPYIFWLRDVQVVNGFAKDAVWLSEVNKTYPDPVLSPRSLRHYKKLNPEQFDIIENELDKVFAHKGYLYQTNPQNLWWNDYIEDPRYHVNRDILEARLRPDV